MIYLKHLRYLNTLNGKFINVRYSNSSANQVRVRFAPSPTGLFS